LTCRKGEKELMRRRLFRAEEEREKGGGRSLRPDRANAAIVKQGVTEKNRQPRAIVEHGGEWFRLGGAHFCAKFEGRNFTKRGVQAGRLGGEGGSKSRQRSKQLPSVTRGGHKVLQP